MLRTVFPNQSSRAGAPDTLFKRGYTEVPNPELNENELPLLTGVWCCLGSGGRTAEPQATKNPLVVNQEDQCLV